MNKLFALLIVGLLAGCNDPVRIAATNARNLKAPETVGITEDGLVIKRYVIDNGISEKNHYVYRIDGQSVTTQNHRVQVGKAVHNEVIVTIDGVSYKAKAE